MDKRRRNRTRRKSHKERERPTIKEMTRETSPQVKTKIKINRQRTRKWRNRG